MMSDEALNKHLDWLDECAEEQGDTNTLVSIPCGCEIVEVLEDRQGEAFLRIRGCEEHPMSQGVKKGNAWAIVNYIRNLETEIEALRKSEDYYKTGAKQTGKQAGRPRYVPKRISIPRTVRSDFPGSRVSVHPGEYDAHVNQYGAVSIKLGGDDFLGIMLDEFDVVEWQENPALREKKD